MFSLFTEPQWLFQRVFGAVQAVSEPGLYSRLVGACTSPVTLSTKRGLFDPQKFDSRKQHPGSIAEHEQQQQEIEQVASSTADMINPNRHVAG